MNINQLTANIDAKLSQLRRQIEDLQHQLDTAATNKRAQTGIEHALTDTPSAKKATEENPTIDEQTIGEEIRKLQQLQRKLIQSRILARRAHELQTQQYPVRPSQQQRIIAVSLCAFSAVSLILLAVIALTQ